MYKRILALLLCALTLFACVSPGFAAEADSGTDPPVEQMETPAEPATEEQTEAVTVTPTDAPTEAETEAPTETQTEAPTEKPALPFEESETVDGVTVTVTAESGVFPEGAALSFTRIEGKTEDKISKAIQTESGGEQNVALSYAFDIKVLDADGEELQPADGSKVTVSFETEEVADRNLSAQVYHVSEDSGKLVAEQLDTTEDGSTVSAETDGFSFYTLEFTYDSMQYVMDGDSSVPLSAILDEVGLTGVVTEVSVSNEELFNVHGEAGKWMVFAHQAFSSEEWMRVTINGVEYEITVTDAAAGFFKKNDFSGVGAENDENCYLMYGTRNNGSGWGINVHQYQDANGTRYWAYCLDWGRDSGGTSASPDSAYTIGNSLPTSVHGGYVSSYALAAQVALLGYGNQSNAEAKRMFGLSASPNSYEYYQATQAAMWAVIKSGTGSAPETVANRPFKVRAAPAHTDTIGVTLANKMAAAAYAIYQSPPAITLGNFTRSSLSLTSATYQTTVTWSNCYGGFDLVFGNLPSGYSITKSGTATTVSGSTVQSTQTSGTATITITIPRQSAARTVSAELTTVMHTRALSLKYGTAQSSSKQNLVYLSAAGSPMTASKSILVPALPTGSITVVKQDAQSGANLSSCVFGLRKYNGSAYVDTGTTATTGADGKATFSGLATDTASTGYYQVYEKTAPTGYEPDSRFYCSFRVGTGWYSYVSTLAGNQSGTLSNGGTVNATVSGASKPVINVSKSGDNYSATVYLYDTPKQPDTFNITLNKRDLSTGNSITGATYQLYVADSGGAWTPFESGRVNDSGTVTFTGLKVSDSVNGTFRVVESAMANSGYQLDSTFEALVNPATGEWSYTGSCVSPQSGAFSASGTICASVHLPEGSTAERVIISAEQEGLFSFAVWQDDPPEDVFSITVSKRSLHTGEALVGAEYKLYGMDSGEWSELQTIVSTDSTIVFEGLRPSDSANGRFRLLESAMTDPAYVVDEAFEVFLNPATGEWWYTSAFTGPLHGDSISGEVTATVDTKDGNFTERTILRGSQNSSGRYDFHIWQDDSLRTTQNLTVSKVVTVQGEVWPVSGVTFTLQHQTGESWEDVCNLTEQLNQPGSYQVPKDANGHWLCSMTEGDTYRIVESQAAEGVINSGWISDTFVWNPYADLELSFAAEDALPNGYLGLVKVDSETNVPLEGVGFTITAAEDIVDTVGSNSVTWYHSGDPVAAEETDADGMILVENLPYGTYRVTETTHPREYAWDNVSFTVTIDAPSGYSSTKAYTNPMIGYTTYPSGRSVTTVGGLRYVTVENTPIHPDMAVAKLTERTLNPSGSPVTFNPSTGRYTQTKVSGTYYNGQAAKFTLTATNTGDVDLYHVRLVDVMSESLWTVVRKQTGNRTTDVTFRQVNSTPLALGNALAVGSSITTSHGKTARVTAVSYRYTARYQSRRRDGMK